MTATNDSVLDEEMSLFIKAFVVFFKFVFSKSKYSCFRRKMGLSHSTRSSIENHEAEIDNISNERRVVVNKKPFKKQENKNYIDKNKNSVIKPKYSIKLADNSTQTDEIVSSIKHALKRFSQHTQTSFGKELKDTDSQTDNGENVEITKPVSIIPYVSQQTETVLLNLRE